MKIVKGEGWEMRLGDCVSALSEIGNVDHVISDPPYSAHTHGNARGNRGRDGIVTRDFGFSHLSPITRRSVAQWSCENASGWLAFFTDRESSWLWRLSIEVAGGSYRRTIPWIRWSSPQFNGQAPPSSAEDIVFAKPKARKSKWHNGGRTHYDTKCLRSSNKVGDHPTEKPTDLMASIIEDCTLDGELVCDMFAGSGTTGVAALSLGRRFVGVEQNEEHFNTACERLRAVETGNTLSGIRSGQGMLF